MPASQSHPYDRSGHWLVTHQGGGILYLAGETGVASWRAVATDVVQPRRLPDGLLEVFFTGQKGADLFLLEISTYPDARVAEQMLKNALLVFLDRGLLPEVVTLVLCPRGQFRLDDTSERASRRGHSHLQLRWRVVELWTIPAETLLACPDVGVVPWVPLAAINGPVEPVLRQCRERIDREARPDEQANMLAVIQVLMRLRYNDPSLFELFGGERAMIESPLIDELICRRLHKAIIRVLAARFGSVPSEVATLLQAITDEARLDTLVDWAATCPDLEAFRSRLTP